MSYTSEYYSALEKLKKKRNYADTDEQGNDYTAQYYRALNEIQSRPSSSSSASFVDDIAPVKGGNKDSIFKAGSFDDGYQFGDITSAILGTTADLGLGIVKGAGRLVEGVVDLGTYAVGGVGDALGFDDFAEKTKKVAQYSATDEWTKGATDYVDQYSVLGNKADMVSEGLGQVGAIILTGGAAGAAGLGTAGVTAVTTGLTGLSGMGSGMNEAYSMGATDEEALKYGATVGSVEAASELIFGGLGKGVKALGLSKGLTAIDDVAAKKISNIAAKYITSEAGQKVVGNTLEWAVKSGAEGLEEVISGFGSAIAKDVYLYNDENEKPFSEILADENLLEQFVVGSITSGIAQSGVVPGMKSGSLIESNKTGRDFVTGYTASDQTIIDKVVEERIAEAEKDGKKLTNKEKNNIIEQVQDALEKGQLDIDMIESTLGGDTYTAYKDNLTETEKLKQELEELSNIKRSDMTRAQEKRLEELEAMNLDDTSKSDGLRKQLNDKLKPLLKDSKLTETYKERARRGEAFTADLTKYTGKQKEAVERAIKSGVLNNTYRSHELVDVLSKIEAEKGIAFDYTNNEKLKESGFAIQGKTVNGFEKDGTVTLNVQSSQAWQSTVGHEITHVLEGTEAYGALQSALFKYAESKGEYQSRYDKLTELYKGVKGYETDFDAKVTKELTADLVGDYLFTDKAFINHLTGDRNLFQKVYDEIKYLWNVATGKEKTEIEKVKEAFDEAWKQLSAEGVTNETNISTEGMTETDINEATEYSDPAVLYSIREEAPPKETGIAYKVFFVKDGKLYPPMVANPDGADTPIGVWLNADVGTAAPPSKTGRAQVKAGGKGTQGGSGSLAFRPGWHLGDLPRASQFDRVNPETGKKELFPENFVWAEVEYAKDVDYQEEAMSYGYTENGKFRHAYAGLPKLPENGYYRYRTNPKPDTVPWVITGAMKVNRLLSDAEVNAILEQNGVAPVHRQGGDVGLDKFGFDENGTVQYSISTDSNGNQLSKEQSEYFKDSKVRDDNGNLLVMYHGSPNADFTVFKSGTYFTEHKWYADVYQGQGASSLGYKKTANNPDTYAVYLDIKKPFDTRNKTERDIFYNEYYRQWGTGTDLMESGLPDWLDGQDLQEFLEENGYDYDGLILDEGGVGGYGDEVKSRGISYVTFSPEQVKNIDNKNPTSDPDIRFSLSESVEETKDLIAVHNLKSDELIKTLELGGLPMPSIAILKAEQGHEKYGDVSLIFPRETIDPKVSSDNKVYGGDAWTPTYPRIEYKARESVAEKVRDKYYELANKIGYDAVRPMYRYANELESALNSEGGEANLLDWIYNDTKMMQVYLEDSGKGRVEDVVKETRTEATEADKVKNQWFIDKLGEDVIRGVKTPEGKSFFEHRKAFVAEHKAEIKSAWESLCRDVYHLTEEQVQNIMRDTTDAMYLRFIKEAEQYLHNGGVTIKTETDYKATEDAIIEKAADGYKAWVDDLFKGAEEKTGIRNDKDIFKNNGNRRSWNELHWENTLENVVKAMKAQDQTGADAFSPASAIFAVAHKRYGSVEDIKADSNRLGRVSEEEYKAMEEAYASRLAKIAKSIEDPSERNPFVASDRAANEIIDAVRNYKTKNGMLRYMQKWNSRVTESTVDDILSLVSDIANMPTGYFEAKPQRAVGLEEVGVFVIPNNADATLKQALLDKGYSIAEYDPNVEGDRKRVVNQFEELKFSISNEDEQFAPIGNYSTPLNETALEDIAPVKESDVEAETVKAETVDEKISAKLKNLQTELENNKRLRDESNADFDTDIAWLQAEYAAKKNKNTKAANDLLRRIERMQRRKADENARYEARISSLSERINKVNTPQYRRGEQRRAKQDQFANEIRNLIGNTATWVDKKLGISYQTNTLHRNLRDVVRDANGNRDIAKADEIYEYLQGSYNRNEAALKRESQAIKQKYADMKINKHESEYIQMLGEFNHNPDTKLTLEAVDEYFEKHKEHINIDKVKKAIEMSRKDYDDLIKRVNAVLREQGMKEIAYKEGYFPHFTETKQSWLGKLFNWKTIDNEIPTDIAGLTEEFEPVRTYQSFDKHRKSDETDYNFLKGFDTYVHGALDWIYHIEDIQKRRAFENEIRYSHSEQGIRDKIDEIRKKKDLDADEVQALLDNVYKEAKNPLNNFVTDLRNSTNNLAGKKSTTDRAMEYATNRKVYSTMTNISNRVSGNMVVGSISSALTNFIPITQSWGQVSPVSSLKAVGDVVRNTFRKDGMIEKSTFMTNRLIEEENLEQTGWDKASKVAGGLMNVFDHFTTEVVWRSKYIENMNNGMSESEAISNADVFAENVMAGRSRGNMPTIYNSKNPLTKMLTAFQLEVANQYGYMFKDLPQDVGEKNIGKLTSGYAKMFIGAYVYNALFSALTGRDAAFDPIGILEDLMKDLGFGGDDEEEADVLGAVKGLGENIMQEIPYVGGLLGGGRIPISSALPYDSVTDMVTGTIDDVANKDWENLTNEWMNPVYYLALPFGGGQLKKTNEGLNMFSDEHPVAGSYTASGKLRFPVEDTPLNRVQAGLFGQYASENAREYFDNDYAPLAEKQIQEYKDVDIPIKDYWEYREGLKKQETLEDKFDYISGLDLPVKKKNILINNIVDREDKVDMEGYEDFSGLEEFDFATKNPEKYAFAKSVGGYSAYKTYSNELYDIKADKDEFGKSITGSRKEKVLQYINNLDADYETKIILFKSEYPSDDTYNAEIINYLNNRTDLTYEDRVAILTELGFRVVNGQIYVD